MQVTEAKAIAELAHEGQHYGVRPYIEHVRDVVWRVSRDPRGTPTAIAVAWLHDVVEDGHTTLEALVSEHGLAGDQIAALRAITREHGESYPAYISRLCKNPTAALVKLHDLQSNIAAGPPAELRGRYERARVLVRDALLGVVYCRAKICRAPIVYLRTKGGSYMPVDRDSLPEHFDHERLVFNSDLGHVSHFATCPDAKRFRRAKR